VSLINKGLNLEKGSHEIPYTVYYASAGPDELSGMQYRREGSMMYVDNGHLHSAGHVKQVQRIADKFKEWVSSGARCLAKFQ
jgi:hypothetical protein